MRITTVSGAALAAIVLVASGCGGGDDDKSSTAAVQTTAGEPSTQPVSTEAADPASAPEPTDSQDVLGSRNGQIDGDPVRLEITELRRSGATSAITIRLVFGGDDGSAQIADTLDDGISDAENGNEYDTNDGISLIDTVNRKRYLVARDSSGRCVCDNSLSGTFVEAAGPTVLSATFAAPPENVKAVDVVIPRFGTFKNVPIS